MNLTQIGDQEAPAALGHAFREQAQVAGPNCLKRAHQLADR
jgi:hypothetical protein